MSRSEQASIRRDPIGGIPRAMRSLPLCLLVATGCATASVFVPRVSTPPLVHAAPAPEVDALLEAFYGDGLPPEAARRAGRADQAAAFFEQASRMAPELARPYERLGSLA